MKKEYVITLILVACVLGCLFYSSIRNLQAIGFEPGLNIAALKCATSIYCSDDVWIGIDSDEGRIVFDNQATDEVNIMSANVGIGDNAPGTLLQLKGANAYLTLQNETNEHTDGAAETKIIFEDHANAALAQIQGCHDGTSDDTKGQLIFYTHTGSALSEVWRLDATGIQTSNGLTIRNYSAALADEAEITVATGTAGFGFVQIGDNQEYAQFTWTAAGVVSLVYNTANVLNTDTDANLCIYDAGSGIAIKNRLGSELTVRFVLNYS